MNGHEASNLIYILIYSVYYFPLEEELSPIVQIHNHTLLVATWVLLSILHVVAFSYKQGDSRFNVSH